MPEPIGAVPLEAQASFLAELAGMSGLDVEEDDWHDLTPALLVGWYTLRTPVCIGPRDVLVTGAAWYTLAYTLL